MNAVEAIAYMGSGGAVFVKDSLDDLMYLIEDGLVKTKSSPYDGSVEPEACVIDMDGFMVREYVKEDEEELSTREVLEIFARQDGTKLYTRYGSYFADELCLWYTSGYTGVTDDAGILVSEIYNTKFYLKEQKCAKQY